MTDQELFAYTQERGKVLNEVTRANKYQTRDADEPADVLLRDAINHFAKDMYNKALLARDKYGFHPMGWACPDWQEEMQRQMAEHVLKGDPRDTGWLSTIAWYHGWSTATPSVPLLQEGAATPAPLADAELADGLPAYFNDLVMYRKSWEQLGKILCQAPRKSRLMRLNFQDAEKGLANSIDVIIGVIPGLLARLTAAEGKLSALSQYQQERGGEELGKALARIKELEDKGSPGVMHAIDKSFYELAVKERDYERIKNNNLNAELEMAYKGASEFATELSKYQQAYGLLTYKASATPTLLATVEEGPAEEYPPLGIDEDLISEVKEILQGYCKMPGHALAVEALLDGYRRLAATRSLSSLEGGPAKASVNARGAADAYLADYLLANPELTLVEGGWSDDAMRRFFVAGWEQCAEALVPYEDPGFEMSDHAQQHWFGKQIEGSSPSVVEQGGVGGWKERAQKAKARLREIEGPFTRRERLENEINACENSFGNGPFSDGMRQERLNNLRAQLAEMDAASPTTSKEGPSHD